MGPDQAAFYQAIIGTVAGSTVKMPAAYKLPILPPLSLYASTFCIILTGHKAALYNLENWYVTLGRIYRTKNYTIIALTTSSARAV